MLTTVILIIKQFISSFTPRGVKLDFVLREICCHDLISSLEQDDETYCDDAESEMTLGWSQLWGRISGGVRSTPIRDVRVIRELKSTSNTIFNSRKRSELVFNYRDSVIRPWVIFRQAVGDDIQYSSSIYLKSTMSLLAIVLFSMQISRPKGKIHYVYYLRSRLPYRCCPHLYGRRSP